MPTLRSHMAAHMNSNMLKCSASTFIKDYSPSIAVENEFIEECKTELLRTRVMKLEDKRLTWSAYELNPSKMGISENIAFQGFVTIVERIWGYADEKGRKGNSFFFKMVPCISGTNHKTCARTIEHNYEGALQCNNIVMPVVLKTNANVWETKKEIREQVVSDCNTILCEDPRRMFIYALTVEDNMMSAWYFSRTHCVKSDSFDWINKDINTFIHLMLSFALATPQELGIDPYVHKLPVPVGGEQQWVYELVVDANSGTVDSSSNAANPTVNLGPHTPAYLKQTTTNLPEGKKRLYYKTVKFLGPEHSLWITGRMTRIWVVKQVSNLGSDDRVAGTKDVILKDTWTDADARTEAQNMNDMFKAVDEFVERGLKRKSGPDSMAKFIENERRFFGLEQSAKNRIKYLLTDRNYRNLFLTKLHAWDGATTKPQSTHARIPSTPIFFPSFDEGEASQRPSESLAHISNTAETLQQHPDSQSPKRRFRPKTQRRFVYEEICTPLRDLPNLGIAINVLSQAWEALAILYCAGWVHRDISTGNILAVASEDHGEITYHMKLSDLEFAQPQGHAIHRTDPRTGTPHFVPVEIMRRQYLFANLYRHPDAQLKNGTSSAQRRSKRELVNMAMDLKLKSTHPHFATLQHYNSFDAIKHFPVDGEDDCVPATLEIPSPTDLVSHNFHHDLESLWWIFIYLITNCVGHVDSEKATATIFRGDLDASPRQLFLMNNLPTSFYASLLSPLKQSFPECMDVLRRALRECCMARPLFGQLHIPEAFSSLHGDFAAVFDDLLQDNTATWQKVPLRSSHSQKDTVVLSTNRRGDGVGPGSNDKHTSKRRRIS